MKLKYLLSCGAAAALLSLFSSSAMASLTYGPSGLCPVNGTFTTDCNLIITFNADGSISTSGPGGNYDGAEDALIGVINNTAHTITSFNIAGTFIFGMNDYDGINVYTGVTNAAAGMSDAAFYAAMGGPSSGPATVDPYGGADAFFTGVNTSTLGSGTVNFLHGIAANGGHDYFSLEESISLASLPTIGQPVTVPEPASMALLGLGLAGLAFSKRKKA